MSLRSLAVSQELVQQIVTHAREEAPNECCGVLTGVDGRALKLHRARNADASPVKYTVDPTDLVRITSEADKDGQEIVAFYHSHTATEAYPSPTDVRRAAPTDLWGYLYLIVSLEDPARPDLKAFAIFGEDSQRPFEQRVEPVQLVITG